MSKEISAAPLLPPASVDFNALHDSIMAGEKADAALEKGVIKETVALTADQAAAEEVKKAAATPAPKAKG